MLLSLYVWFGALQSCARQAFPSTPCHIPDQNPIAYIVARVKGLFLYDGRSLAVINQDGGYIAERSCSHGTSVRQSPRTIPSSSTDESTLFLAKLSILAPTSTRVWFAWLS